MLCVSGQLGIIPVSFSYISFQMINWIYLIKCSEFKNGVEGQGVFQK